eukprot:Gb_38706 [translate_table: standard]
MEGGCKNLHYVFGNRWKWMIFLGDTSFQGQAVFAKDNRRGVKDCTETWNAGFARSKIKKKGTSWLNTLT